MSRLSHVAEIQLADSGLPTSHSDVWGLGSVTVMPASVACEDLFAFEVGRDRLKASRLSASMPALRLVGHVRKLGLVGADVGDLMRDDQMRFVVSTAACTVITRPSQSHARWSPSSGNLRIGEWRSADRARHSITFCKSASEWRLTSSSSLISFSLSRVVAGHNALSDGASPEAALAIGCVKLAQIARNALLDLRQVPLRSFPS